MTVQEQVDRAYRVAYRLAYPIVWCWWRLLKRQQGVVVAVWLNVSAQLGAHSKMGRGGTVMVSTINVDTMDERSLELFEA